MNVDMEEHGGARNDNRDEAWLKINDAFVQVMRVRRVTVEQRITL